MRFGKENDETRLEHELRAQRPQPRDEFVQMLSREITPPRHARRSGIPKFALVAAVTAALAVSLGAAGALGAAGGSVHAFSIGVVHLVAPPRAAVVTRGSANTHGAPTPQAAPTTNTSAAPADTTTTSSHITSYENATPSVFPFQSQYGFKFPICYQGSLIYVSFRDLVWYVFHGALPARRCGGIPRNP